MLVPLRRVACAVLLGAVLLGAVVLTGCAGREVPRAEVATRPAAAALPWPGADLAALQRDVDSGSQPWLLDPAEVAVSYAAATRGWTAAQAFPDAGDTADGDTVEVRGRDGEALVLVLRQPGRTGPTGIWVVTAESVR